MTSEFQWERFSDHLGSVLRELFLDQSSSDVTLVCDDLKQYKLHKFVLRASSQTLKTLLDSHPHPNPLIYLRGVSSQQLEAILEFIYLGETTFHHDKVTDFLKVAADLEIKDILNGLVSPEIGNEKSPAKNEELADKKDEDDDEANTLSLQQTKESPEDCDIDHIPSTDASSAMDGEHETIEEDDNDPDISVQESIKNQEAECIIKEEMEEKAEDLSKLKEEEISSKKGKKRKRSQSTLKKDPDEDLFLCDRCDFKSKRREPFTTHYQYEHEGVKYECSQCHLEYKTKKYLQTHVKSVHEGVKYPCTKCDYKATQECNLKVHMESIHEGIRHLCHHCPYKATQRRHLQTHMKRVHK